MLPYVSFLRWIKFCSGDFRQDFFIWRLNKWSLVKLDRWLSYRVTTIWDFAWVDSALVVLDELSSYRAFVSTGLSVAQNFTEVIKFIFLFVFFLAELY